MLAIQLVTCWAWSGLSACRVTASVNARIETRVEKSSCPNPPNARTDCDSKQRSELFLGQLNLIYGSGGSHIGTAAEQWINLYRILHSS